MTLTIPQQRLFDDAGCSSTDRSIQHDQNDPVLAIATMALRPSSSAGRSIVATRSSGFAQLDARQLHAPIDVRHHRQLEPPAHTTGSSHPRRSSRKRHLRSELETNMAQRGLLATKPFAGCNPLQGTVWTMLVVPEL
jgi:hypothetical protein